jgi:hypothetical protein
VLPVAQRSSSLAMSASSEGAQTSRRTAVTSFGAAAAAVLLQVAAPVPAQAANLKKVNAKLAE